MRVGMYPNPFSNDIWNRQGNPHLKLLSLEIKRTGWDVVPITENEIRNPSSLNKKSLDILHLHWPESIYYSQKLRDKKFFLPDKVFQKWALRKITKWVQKMKGLVVPIIWQVHDLYPHPTANDEFLFPIDNLLSKNIYQLADAIVIHELSCKKFIYEHFQGKKPFGVAPLGSYSLVYGLPREKQEAKKILNIPGDGKVFAYVGTVRKNRNPKDVVRAFQDVASPKDTLLVAGSGVKGAVGNLSDARILLLDGFLPKEMIRDVFCASDFVVNHAKNYLTSAVVRTAMSYSVPVIDYPYGSTLDMAGNAMVLIEDENGGLKHALALALDMPADRYREMVKSAAQRDLERQWPHAGSACVKLYNRILSSDC